MITRLLARLFGWDKEMDEYWERFIVPQVKRGAELGIPVERLETLYRQAVAESDFITTYPRGRFRDLIDKEVETA